MYIAEPYLEYDHEKLKMRSKTDLIVLHHTGNGEDDDLSAADINRIHRNINNWACIGYHFVIRKNGSIERGRPVEMTGAHAYGNNSHSIGIHLSGNFEIAEPTTYQIESVARLIAKLCFDYSLPIDKDHIVGHRELNATACPGENLYKLLDTIIGKANWYACKYGFERV